jgi:transposase
MQAVHRTRSLFVKHRTSVINQIRGLLAEYGLVTAQIAVNRTTVYLVLKQRSYAPTPHLWLGESSQSYRSP